MQNMRRMKWSPWMGIQRFLYLDSLCAALFLLTPGLLAQAPANARTPNTARASDPLHQLSDSFQALVRRVSPSVVQVLVTGYGLLEDHERNNTGVVIGRQRSIGSGVILDPDGYIVTNAHVVRSTTGSDRFARGVDRRITSPNSSRCQGTQRGSADHRRVAGNRPSPAQD